MWNESIEIYETFKAILENLKDYKNNVNKDYSIFSTLNLYPRILKMFQMKDERLKALIMLYTVNANIDDLKNWKLEDLKNYIYDTVDDEYVKEYDKLFKIIEKGE